MTKTKKNKQHYDLPPLNTILAAMQADALAMDELIQFYQPYIRTLSIRKLHDDFNCTYEVVDEQRCRELEIKLIMSVLKFQIL